MELSYIILFHDHSKKIISQQDYQIYLQGKKQGRSGMLIGDGVYSFSSMAKVLTMDEYFQQYPENKPAIIKSNSFPTIEEMMNKMPIKSKTKALEQLIIGLGRYIAGPKYQGTEKPIELLAKMEKKLI